MRDLWTMTRLGVAGAAALALSGCGGGIGILDYGSSAVAKVGSSLPFQAKPQPARTLSPAEAGVSDCPQVEVLEGTSAVRVGGEANASVRYQYSLGNVARECSVVGGQLAIKVGVDGRVLLGPAGAPGVFNAALRIAVRRDSDQKPLSSSVYRIAANIPAGETQATFTQVSDQILVPYTGPAAAEDYTVLVGFDNGNSRQTNIYVPKIRPDSPRTAEPSRPRSRRPGR